MRAAMLALVLALAPGATAAEAAGSVDEARLRALLYELRCLVCQNQSLADSDAELAGDLRRRVRTLMAAGKSDAEIMDHLQARYGDFVLYRPPFAWRTAALWLGPFLLLALAAWALLRRVRRRHAAPAPELTAAERARLARALGEERER